LLRTPRIGADRFTEALFEEAAYRELLTDVAQTIGARSVAAGWRFHDGTAAMMIDNAYWSPDQVARYDREFASTDIWSIATFAHWRPGTVVDLNDLVDDSEYARSEIWNEFFRPLGDDTWRAMSVTAQNDLGLGGITFHRGRGENGFSDAAKRFLARHANDLARLHALRGRVFALERKAAVSTEVLNAIGRAIFVVTPLGMIVHSNIAGQDLLETTDLLGSRDGLLTAAPAVMDAQLKDALATVAASSGHQCMTAMVLQGKNGNSISLSIVRGTATGCQPQVIVIADSNVGADQTLEQRLRALYALSPSEASIAVMLTAGLETTAIAEQRGVSIQTVRLQIKTIASKLGCSRQAQIVSIVSSLPALYRSKAGQ
jgi:DNA-binding CsgD family transcriptional regulator